MATASPLTLERNALPVAGRLPRHVRWLTAGWGWFMLAMGGVNAWLAVSGRSEVYVEFIETTYVELCRTAWDALVAPHPLPWVLVLACFEATIGVGTLRGGRARLIALGTSAAFIVALTPSNVYTLGNPVLAVLPGYLLVRHVRARRDAGLAEEGS